MVKVQINDHGHFAAKRIIVSALKESQGVRASGRRPDDIPERLSHSSQPVCRAVIKCLVSGLVERLSE